jgi:hypothetical protein
MSSATMTARIQDQFRSNEITQSPPADELAATGVGWFSIALGTAEILAPSGLARLIGVDLDPKLVRLFGAREFASGVGILTQSRPTGWLWGRVIGDFMDLAVLASAPLRSERGAQTKLATAAAAVVGVTLLDVVLGVRYSAK